MRDQLEHSIQDIKASFLRMLSINMEQLSLVQKGLITKNFHHLSEHTKKLDLEVDQLEHDLEAMCLTAIALHQPVAGDLRFIVMVLKSLTDSERIGDYAVHVATDLEQLAGTITTGFYSDIQPLVSKLTEMMETLAYAFAEKNLRSVKDLQEMDLEVDAFYEQLQRSTLTRVMEDLRMTSSALKLTRLARSFERLGDHMVNISERIHYWITGMPFDKALSQNH